MCSDLLEREDVDDEELNLVCLTFISAGMAPIVATLQWSLALLAQRPDIQATACEALLNNYGDGEHMLGKVDDDQGCEYIVALVKGACSILSSVGALSAADFFGCFTVVRTSLPRCIVKEFTYDGKPVLIGTTILLNAWAYNMDTAIWTQPNLFDPTRWINNPNAPIFIYGIGSRSCTGVTLANRLLYLFFVRVISAFENSLRVWRMLILSPVSGARKIGFVAEELYSCV
ncbi:uncharacterized protein PAC_17053 [Phialocephala subalpina]|uniref:Cytochrome P450 n=1 Tax=Phialocephala subalpina TaxID=576137 RepID=A0A1L7XQ39_9HELO|nr:uncharacterized protein PAC_17053 [Phialocephala subalpina]